MFKSNLIALFTALSIVKADSCSNPCGNAGNSGNPTNDLTQLLQNGNNCFSPSTNDPMQLLPNGTNVVPGQGACVPLPQQFTNQPVYQQFNQPQNTPMTFSPVVSTPQQAEPQKTCNLTTSLNCTPAAEQPTQSVGVPTQQVPPQNVQVLPPITSVVQSAPTQSVVVPIQQAPQVVLPSVQVPMVQVPMNQIPMVQQPQTQQPQQPQTQQPLIQQCPNHATFPGMNSNLNNGKDYLFSNCAQNASNKVDVPTVIVGNIELPAAPNMKIEQMGCGSTANRC